MLNLVKHMKIYPYAFYALPGDLPYSTGRSRRHKISHHYDLSESNKNVRHSIFDFSIYIMIHAIHHNRRYDAQSTFRPYLQTNIFSLRHLAQFLSIILDSSPSPILLLFIVKRIESIYYIKLRFFPFRP